MKRDSYSDQQSRASFQPKSSQPAIAPTQFGQPVHHSSSTSGLGSNWLNKASGWVANKFQTAQNLVNGSGDAIAPDQVLPALRGTTSSPSQSAQSQQPLVGVIDSGFGAGEHGGKMVEAIQKDNPQAQIWKGEGVGVGGWSESLIEFVDTAKASGHSRAVANLSFDLTEVHPDGSTSNRSQLTADEQSALTYARDNDVLLVASSGNQGGTMSALGQASQPSDNLIVVGAANGSDRASYSSYGNGLDLVAEVGTAGTSSAAATVTGTIAQLWSANPELSSQQVNQILTTTATDLKTPGRDAETGAGLLNSTGAIDLATHTAPESIVFSGAHLIQPVPESLGSTTWESRDGTIASERTAGLGDWLKDNAHSVLDVAGFIPGVGAVADIANAGLYAAEGDYANAALSAAAAVPGIGDAAAAIKLANRGVQAVSRGARAIKGASAARAIPTVFPRRLQLEAPPRRLAIEGRTTARPLYDRGARLEPGQRAMTREQWSQHRRDQRANQSVQRLSGHGHERHGSQVSLRQLSDRVQHGLLPNGRTQRKPGRATRFDSPQREMAAVGRARAQLRAEGSGRPVLTVNSRGEVGGADRTYTVPGSRDGYGRGVEVRRRKNEQPLPGRRVRRTAQDPNARVDFRYDFIAGRWKEITHYPTHKPVT